MAQEEEKIKKTEANEFRKIIVYEKILQKQKMNDNYPTANQ